MIKVPESAKEKLFQILEKHVPENAVHYCYDLWIKKPFHFKVTRKRQTKLGDYRFDQVRGEHTITVNFNLNPYNFLITYIHEYAHLITTEKYGRRVSPHGREWRKEFQQVLLPVMNELVLPPDILGVLRLHMRNPKASTQSDPRLVKALRRYDENTHEEFLLDDVAINAQFIFKGSLYQKLESRRTRVLCHHVDSGKRYLIPKIARVESVGQ